MAFTEQGRNYTYYTRRLGNGKTSIVRVSRDGSLPIQEARHDGTKMYIWGNSNIDPMTSGYTKLGNYGDIVNFLGKTVRINSDGTFTNYTGIHGGRRYANGKEDNALIIAQKGNYQPLLYQKDYTDKERIYKGNNSGLYYKFSEDGKKAWARTSDNKWTQLTDKELLKVNSWWRAKGLTAVNTDAKAFTDDALKTHTLRGKAYLGNDHKTNVTIGNNTYDLSKRHHVLQLQDFLISKGLYKGPRDGIFGKQSAAALTEWGNGVTNRNDIRLEQRNTAKNEITKTMRSTSYPYLNNNPIALQVTDSYSNMRADNKVDKDETFYWGEDKLAPSNKHGGTLYYRYFR